MLGANSSLEGYFMLQLKNYPFMRIDTSYETDMFKRSRKNVYLRVNVDVRLGTYSTREAKLANDILYAWNYNIMGTNAIHSEVGNLMTRCIYEQFHD